MLPLATNIHPLLLFAVVISGLIVTLPSTRKVVRLSQENPLCIVRSPSILTTHEVDVLHLFVDTDGSTISEVFPERVLLSKRVISVYTSGVVRTLVAYLLESSANQYVLLLFLSLYPVA